MNSENHECHVCGKIATVCAEDPALAEMHPEFAEDEWWCEDYYNDRFFEV